MKPTKATLEWHWYCPKCERSCLSRKQGNPAQNWSVTCSDCGFRYNVESGPQVNREEKMWINANRERPPKNKVVLFRDLKNDDKIIKAQYGKWTHHRDGKYESWHVNGSFENYLDDGQYWMEIPKLP